MINGKLIDDMIDYQFDIFDKYRFRFCLLVSIFNLLIFYLSIYLCKGLVNGSKN